MGLTNKQFRERKWAGKIEKAVEERLAAMTASAPNEGREDETMGDKDGGNGEGGNGEGENRDGGNGTASLETQLQGLDVNPEGTGQTSTNLGSVPSTESSSSPERQARPRAGTPVLGFYDPNGSSDGERCDS